MNRILQMIFRQLLNRGMRAGIDRMATGGRDPSEMTREERDNAKAARQNGRRATQAMRAARRLGKF